MENFKLKEMHLLPPKGTIFVKAVGIEAENGKIYTPATNRTDKEMSFGKVIFAGKCHCCKKSSKIKRFFGKIFRKDLRTCGEKLVGEIILVDPWRKTPLTINGQQFIQLYSESGFTIVKDKND